MAEHCPRLIYATCEDETQPAWWLERPNGMLEEWPGNRGAWAAPRRVVAAKQLKPVAHGRNDVTLMREFDEKRWEAGGIPKTSVKDDH